MHYKLLFLQLKLYIFSLLIESDDSSTVSDNEYLCKKSESSHSSKCMEISSAPKAKKLKLENIFPPIGWSDNLNNITHTRNTPFTSNTGPTDLFDDCTTEADFFLKIVTKDMISYIVESTNEYAILKKSSFTTSFSKILFFLGFIIYTGISSLPDVTMYWSKDSAYNRPFISDRITKNRYMDLIRYFHISKKNEEKKDNKLRKVFLFM